MSADKPPGDNTDRPAPPRVEDRVVPTRTDDAGSKHHTAEHNRTVHAKLAGMTGQARTAVGQLGDTARNLADQTRIGGKLAAEGAVDAGRKVAQRVHVVAEKLEKPAHAGTAILVGAVGMHLPMNLEKVPPPTSRDDSIAARSSVDRDAKPGYIATAKPAAGNTSIENAKAPAAESRAATNPGHGPDDPQKKQEWDNGIDDGLVRRKEDLDSNEKVEKEAPAADNEAVSGPPEWADRRRH